jgi:hypothetical protein
MLGLPNSLLGPFNLYIKAGNLIQVLLITFSFIRSGLVKSYPRPRVEEF